MVKTILNQAWRFFLLIIVILILLKGIALIPVQKLQPVLADKLIILQELEIKIEKYFSDLRLTFKQIAAQTAVEQRYEKLYREVLTRQVALDAVLADNNFLREKLSFAKKYPQALVPAEILSREADHWSNFILVNKGEKQGIRKDMGVINEAGLIGYAYTVFPDSTKVIMITDPRVQISCYNRRNNEVGILAGQLLQPLLLNYINYNSDIQPGDLLLTSGYSLRLPRGIPVGRVDKVTAQKRNYYKTVTVLPLVDFAKLNIVFFLK